MELPKNLRVEQNTAMGFLIISNLYHIVPVRVTFSNEILLLKFVANGVFSLLRDGSDGLVSVTPGELYLLLFNLTVGYLIAAGVGFLVRSKFLAD